MICLSLWRPNLVFPDPISPTMPFGIDTMGRKVGSNAGNPGIDLADIFTKIRVQSVHAFRQHLLPLDDQIELGGAVGDAHKIINFFYGIPVVPRLAITSGKLQGDILEFLSFILATGPV